MENRKIWALSDIHGEAKKLNKLLRRLEFDAGMSKDDILVTTGDVIDRGPDVKRCVEILLEKEQEMECHFLRGNHEQMMLASIQNPMYNQQNWDRNGGVETRKSYHKAPTIYNNLEQWILEVPIEHRDFFYRQELYLNLSIEGIYPDPVSGEDMWMQEDYFFSHAPIPKREYLFGKSRDKYIACDTDTAYLKQILAEPDWDILTWSCHHDHGVSEDKYAMKIPKKFHVVGHIHALMDNLNNNARIYDHIAYIDAGAGCHHSGRLCSIELPSKKLYYI